MRDDLTVADEFIENLIAGNVESYLTEFVGIASKTNYNYVAGCQEQLNRIHQLVGVYTSIATTEDEKKKTARNILDVVVHCRLCGYLKNNPNTIKTVAAERDYYRSRTSAAEDRVGDLEQKLVGAYTAFDKLEQRFETMWQKGPPRKEEEG
jgi:hypothetical protein